MPDLLDSLPRSDRRLVEAMAADAASTPEALSLEMIRAYLALVRAAPAALPDNPLRRLASSAIRKSGS